MLGDQPKTFLAKVRPRLQLTVGAEIHQGGDEAALQDHGIDQGGAALAILAADAVFVGLHAALPFG